MMHMKLESSNDYVDGQGVTMFAIQLQVLGLGRLIISNGQRLESNQTCNP